MSQIDSGIFSTTLLENIVHYQKDDVSVVSKSEKHIVTKRGQ